jgi:hypothetical protein
MLGAGAWSRHQRIIHVSVTQVSMSATLALRMITQRAYRTL